MRNSPASLLHFHEMAPDPRLRLCINYAALIGSLNDRGPKERLSRRIIVLNRHNAACTLALQKFNTVNVDVEHRSTIASNFNEIPIVQITIGILLEFANF